MQAEYNLPDLFYNWPWKKTLNPHFLEAKKESRSWIESFNVFGEKELAGLDNYDFSLLACRTYSYAGKDFARLMCDYLHIIILYDEFTDLVGRDDSEKIVSNVIDSIMNLDTERPTDHILAKIIQEFWRRMLDVTNTTADTTCVRHLFTGFVDYMKACAEEAEDRESSKVRTVMDYMTLRRRTFGAKAFFAWLEFSGINLSDEVFEHPVVGDMIDIAAQLLCITNDMHSYAREQARGLDGHNLITAIILEHHLSLQDALDWLGEYTQQIVSRFLHNMEELPSWGPEIDRDLKEYINRLGNGVRAQDYWSYETKRYYGDHGDEVEKTRIMRLHAPEKGFLT